MNFKRKSRHSIKAYWQLSDVVNFVNRDGDDSEIEIQAAGTSSQASFRSTMSLYISHLRAPTQSELMCKQNLSVNALPHNSASIKEATWFD